MKPVLTSSRLAALLSCAALAGSAYAQNATDKPSGAAAATPAAESKPVELKDPVAVVNGEKISKEELQDAFDKAVKMSGMDAAALTAEQKLAGYHKLLDDMITEKLLLAKAEAIKVTDDDVDKELANVKKQFPDEKAFQEQLKQAGQTEDKVKELIKKGMKERKWVEEQIAGKADVAEADVEKFYKDNIEQFKHPEQVRASHILFMVPQGAPDAEVKKKEEAAKAAYDRAKKGEDFGKLAEELTEEPNGKERKGDLDFFSEEQMVPEFGKKAFSMKVGEVSEPVKTQFGYHVIKVTDKKPAGTVPLDEVKPQLTNYLKNQKQQAAAQEVVSNLRSSAKVENNLPEPPKAPEPPAAQGAPQVDTGSVPEAGESKTAE